MWISCGIAVESLRYELDPCVLTRAATRAASDPPSPDAPFDLTPPRSWAMMKLEGGEFVGIGPFEPDSPVTRPNAIHLWFEPSPRNVVRTSL
jgi:hypothetical protein